MSSKRLQLTDVSELMMWHVGLGGRCQANMSLCHTMAASMPLSCGSKLVWVHLSSTFQPAQAILALSSKNLVSTFQQWHQAMASSSPLSLCCFCSCVLLFLCGFWHSEYDSFLWRYLSNHATSLDLLGYHTGTTTF